MFRLDDDEIEIIKKYLKMEREMEDIKIQENPNDFRTWYDAGCCLARSGYGPGGTSGSRPRENLLNAIKCFRKALSIESIENEAEDALYWLGDTYFRLHYYKRAIKILSKGIAINPDNFDFYSLRGWAYSLDGQYKNAILDYTKYGQYDSSQHWLYFRAQAHFHFKNYGETIKDLTEAIEKSRFWSALYFWRADAYIKLGEYERAIKDYTSLIDDEYGGHRNSESVFLSRGKAYKKSGDILKAKQDFKQAKLLKSQKDEFEEEFETAESSDGWYRIDKDTTFFRGKVYKKKSKEKRIIQFAAWFQNIIVECYGGSGTLSAIYKDLKGGEYPEITALENYLVEKAKESKVAAILGDRNHNAGNFIVDAYEDGDGKLSLALKTGQSWEGTLLSGQCEGFLPYDPFCRLMKDYPEVIFVFRFNAVRYIAQWELAVYVSIFEGGEERYNADSWFDVNRFIGEIWLEEQKPDEDDDDYEQRAYKAMQGGYFTEDLDIDYFEESYDDYLEKKEYDALPELRAFMNLSEIGFSLSSIFEEGEQSSVGGGGGNTPVIDDDVAIKQALEAVKNNGKALIYVPKNVKTTEVCLAAVSQNGRALEYVPESVKTAEVCLAAVYQDGEALMYMPKALRTAEVCFAAVSQNGRAIRYVPENLKTAEVCLAAVSQNGEALMYMPKALRTAEVCFAAVSQNGRAIRYVPENLRTAEVCLAAVSQDGGRALEYVPESVKTVEVCLAAVSQNDWALKYVPEHLKTAEVCFAAISEDGRALGYVPENLKTEEVCLAAVSNSQWGYTLIFVPERLRTAEVCLAAVSENGWALEYVPEHLKTAEVCLAAVSENGWALEYVPEHLKTEEVCFAAVSQNDWALEYVPEHLKTAEVCLAAVSQNGRALEYVPESVKTAEVCLTAVSQNGRALAYVPENLKTAEVCLAAVSQDGRALAYVPEHLKTAEVCLAAIERLGFRFC